MLAAVEAFRARVTDGVAEEEYGLVLDTLRRMAHNLDHAPCPG